MVCRNDLRLGCLRVVRGSFCTHTLTYFASSRPRRGAEKNETETSSHTANGLFRFFFATRARHQSIPSFILPGLSAATQSVRRKKTRHYGIALGSHGGK